jgi:lambda repressor-like predicted transcriptional regulator
MERACGGPSAAQEEVTMSVDAVSTSSALTALLAARSGSSGTSATRVAPPAPPAEVAAGTATSRVPGHVEAAAEALGLSTDEVVEALQDGASLADLAEEQGVSRDDLVAALVADAPADLQAMDGVEDMIGELVDTAGTAGPAGPPPGGSSGVWGEALTADQSEALDAVASLLGTDATALLDRLYGGASLTDLLADAGVSASDLSGALTGGLLIDTTA